MIKALFFDLDGTLLNGQKRIPDSALKALAQCREKGIRLFLATGRFDDLDETLNWTERELSLFEGGVFSNGGILRFGNQYEAVTMPREACEACVALAGRFADVHLSLHLANGDFAFNFVLPEEHYGLWGVRRTAIVPLDPSLYENTIKILVFYDSLVDTARPLPSSLTKEAFRLLSDKASIYLTDASRSLQLSDRKTSKRAGIERILHMLNMDENEIAVFGDDANDIEMLSRFPSSIAMGNASENVRNAASHVTFSNEEDGIAYAVRHILHIL